VCTTHGCADGIEHGLVRCFALGGAFAAVDLPLQQGANRSNAQWHCEDLQRRCGGKDAAAQVLHSATPPTSMPLMELPAPDAPLPLAALIDAAWAEHLRQPARLLERGRQIVARAAPASAEAGWGLLIMARGHRFQGRAAEGDAALAQAESLFDALGPEAGLAGRAVCQEQRAFVLGTQGRWDEAMALLQATATIPATLRRPWERFQGHHRRGWAHDMRGDRDAGLRERYAYLACAHETGDDAAVGMVLGMLAGQHADLFNLEEADRLGAEGVRRAGAAGAFAAWSMAALNHLNALVALGRGADGRGLAEQLMARDAELAAAAREHRLVLYADVLQQCGEHTRAQALLDESVARRHAGSRSLESFTTVQVAVALARGDFAHARQVGEDFLAAPDHGTDPGHLPTERLRLLRALARACEHLGDAHAALGHERQAFDTHDQLVGRSARARRLALEIEHELDRERWQRQQAELERARLDAVNHALEDTSAAKTRFLAAASHDLRQPVQALALNMAALEIESRHAAAPAQQLLVQRMAASLQALTQMFDVLLDISRLDAGIVPVNPQPLPLAPLLRRLHEELEATARARGLRLALHLPARTATATLPPTTRSDPVLLERCLRNLLDNALKYTERGGVLLALRPRQGGWTVQVLDTGIGMTPEVLARACEEFYQADNPERDRRRGLGLGLAIVQRMLRLLGHGFGLASRAGHGTAVTLQLVAETPTAEAALPAAAGAASAPGLLGVIDDDPAVREGLASLLQRWGHGVLHAADDAALLRAWQAAGAPPVQALITDLRLAGHRSGLDAVATLRRAWGEGLPALVITGDIAPERLQALRRSGLPWLAKPVMPMRLRGWLAALPPAGGDRTGGA
jgi:signal transduction histidine kinase/CheY-like chemotaxis protein